MYYDPNREPWEIQPREPVQRYTQFAAYRDMIYDFSADDYNIDKLPELQPDKPGRSLRRIAISLGKKETALYKASQIYDWVSRAAAYDDFVTSLQAQRRLRNIEAMERKQVLLGQLLQAKATERISRMPSDQMTPEDVRRFAETGIKLERLARGMSSDVTTSKQEMSGTIETIHRPRQIDLSRLTEDELDSLDTITAKLNATSADNDE